MEIKEEGKLIVDGGQARQPDTSEYDLGGGGGGIIQIIAPQGSLANGSLSLKKGPWARRCDSGGTPYGYFLLKGNYTATLNFGQMVINLMTIID